MPEVISQYHRYLRIDCWWKQVRQICLERAHYICETQVIGPTGAHIRCPRTATEVHHLTYERIGRERPEDLLACCSDHHRALHNRPAKPPRAANDNQLELPLFAKQRG